MQTQWIKWNQPKLSPKNIILSLGGFDGIHLGHQAIIKKLVKTAEEKKALSALCLFNPLPFQVLRGIKPFKRLFTISELKEILKELNLDFFCVIPFDKKISKLSPHDFINSFLIPHFQPRHVVVGYDFSFAYQKKGSFSMLKAYGQKHGFSIEKAPAYLYEKEPVSSTRIRKYLESGEVEKSAKLLGRPFSIQSKVIKGGGRGGGLGFPTANLKLNHKEYPCLGVYTGSVRVSDRLYKAVINIGRRPTFYKKSDVIVEAHIPEIKQELYNKVLKVNLDRFIRKERFFSDISDLKKQIRQDIGNLF